MKELFMAIITMIGTYVLIAGLAIAMLENNVGYLIITILLAGLFYLAVKGLDKK